MNNVSTSNIILEFIKNLNTLLLSLYACPSRSSFYNSLMSKVPNYSGDNFKWCPNRFLMRESTYSLFSFNK